MCVCEWHKRIPRDNKNYRQTVAVKSTEEMAGKDMRYDKKKRYRNERREYKKKKSEKKGEMYQERPQKTG